jgi:hypothetical protein
MNEVSADHASMYHTGISGVRTSHRGLPFGYRVTGYELLPSGLTFSFMSCVSVTVPSITGILIKCCITYRETHYTPTRTTALRDSTHHLAWHSATRN